MSDLPRMTLNYFTYPALEHLPQDKRAYACWYFYTLAQSAKEQVGESTEDQIIMDDQLWMDTHYVQQAKSVAQMYQLESPDEFAKFWPYVRRQAKALRLPDPDPAYTRLVRRFIN